MTKPLQLISKGNQCFVCGSTVLTLLSRLNRKLFWVELYYQKPLLVLLSAWCYMNIHYMYICTQFHLHFFFLMIRSITDLPTDKGPRQCRLISDQTRSAPKSHFYCCACCSLDAVTVSQSRDLQGSETDPLSALCFGTGHGRDGIQQPKTAATAQTQISHYRSVTHSDPEQLTAGPWNYLNTPPDRVLALGLSPHALLMPGWPWVLSWAAFGWHHVHTTIWAWLGKNTGRGERINRSACSPFCSVESRFTWVSTAIARPVLECLAEMSLPACHTPTSGPSRSATPALPTPPTGWNSEERTSKRNTQNIARP